jgi:hypothetical protein
MYVQQLPVLFESRLLRAVQHGIGRFVLGGVLLLAPNGLVAQEAPLAVQYPLAVAVAGPNEAILVDLDGRTIQRWTEAEGLKLIATGSKTLRQPLNRPRCVAVGAAGELYVGCTASRDVFRVSASADPVGLTGGKIGIPNSVVVRKDGSLLVADLETRRILSVPAGGGEPTEFRNLNARGLFLAADDAVWAVVQGDEQLVKLSPDGKDLQVIVSGRPFGFPHNVVIAEDGTAFVTDGYRKAIWSIPPGGAPEVWFEGEPLQNPVGLALMGDQLLVADPHAKQLFRFGLSDKQPTALLPAAK